MTVFLRMMASGSWLINYGQEACQKKKYSWIDERILIVNPWHDLKSSRIKPENFTAIIEIPKGSKKKYELDKETGLLRLDRILFTATHYPMNYGFIPRTLAEDNDPLDVLVLCSETLDPLVEVDCYAVGLVRMTDNNQLDDKILAIPFNDPVYNVYNDVTELPQHQLNEVSHFFDVYKELEHSITSVKEVCPKDDALQSIADAIKRYQEVFS
jgi:inorganic pyrophosphatase